MTMAQRWSIDCGAQGSPVLGICECGQRFLATDKAAAMDRLVSHETVAHPDRWLIRRAQTRHAETSATGKD